MDMYFDPMTVQRGLPLRKLAIDAAGLDLRVFEERYARGFLVLHGSLGVVSAPMQTGKWRPSPATAPSTDLDEDVPTADLTMTVFLLRRRPTSAHEFISIGRLDGNDIALPDESVSKFHAYVKEAGGTFQLQDARSRNGTMLGATLVPPRGEGAPVVLTPGQAVKLGSVTTTFLGAEGLITLMKRMGLVR